MAAAAAYAALRKTSASSRWFGARFHQADACWLVVIIVANQARTVRYSASALVPSTLMETCLTNCARPFPRELPRGAYCPSRGKICTRLRSAFYGRLEKRNARRCTAARASWHISCTTTRD